MVFTSPTGVYLVIFGANEFFEKAWGYVLLYVFNEAVFFTVLPPHFSVSLKA